MNESTQEPAGMEMREGASEQARETRMLITAMANARQASLDALRTYQVQYLKDQEMCELHVQVSSLLLIWSVLNRYGIAHDQVHMIRLKSTRVYIPGQAPTPNSIRLQEISDT